MRPRSIIAYLAIATASIVGTRWAGPLRWAALATAVLSATYLIKNRQVLARLYLQHATPRAGSDLSNIARHYGVVMVDGGESKFLGRSGFWVAEMMEDETPTGEVVGCIGIGMSQTGRRLHKRHSCSLPGTDSNFYPEPAVAELRRAAVSATTVRQGIGRRLIETALDHCRKHDFKTVRLSTSMYQTSAVKIYEKYGWRYVGPYHFPGMVWWADVHLGSFVLEL